MLEHLFRNINDIRVFDVMTDFILSEEEEKKDPNENVDIKRNSVDIDEIMDILDYREYKRIELDNSLDHLVRQKVLGIKKIKIEGRTGCKICKYTDMFKIPRMGEHKTHISEKISTDYINNYYMKTNEITNGLRSATYAHIMISIGDEIKDIKIKDINIKDEIKDIKSKDN